MKKYMLVFCWSVILISVNANSLSAHDPKQRVLANKILQILIDRLLNLVKRLDLMRKVVLVEEWHFRSKVIPGK